ncbi:uncharacterized protein LOC100161567 [Acyrthosiphon pisum]|uniref:IPT/TIG domain-containing protein n=1 Tax=Acyrthosiphon pisum TaxID=7029 RepID=A0A8R2D480_ACYPI|nr:uncharacterized protein LOC100161567 [Acyrthosiphon pisum]|eukprot:XP_016660657.1 PREDICTED: uncharacterized protein LOC100161567 [Acyrthosiphon pisum]
MANCKKYGKKKNYLNHNSKNGLLLLIYTMALIFESHGTTLGTELNNEICSAAWTCTKCTMKAHCAWSLGYQKCVDNNRSNLSNFTIYSKEKCPRLSVVTKQEYNDELISLQYIVKVSNDEVGFMNYLKESNLYCNSTTIDVHTKIIKNDEIICSANILITHFKLHSVQSFTAFIYIKFRSGVLHLDNIADHYVTFYEHECAENKKDENCATCAWNEHCFAFVRFCSSRNSCEGHNELFLWHFDNGKSWNSKTREVNNQCAEINVTSVDPLSGTIAGGTTITITVKNHLIFEENRTVMVTVAGMVCADPRTSGPETITCITTPPSDDTIYIAPSGPVLVKYTSHERELIIESSQKFHYLLR